MATTSIEWTRSDDGTPGKTWNPTRGCSLISKGCERCYAMKQAHRFVGKGQPYEGLTRVGARGPIWTGEVRVAPEMLGAPLRWRKPCRVFVDSMSDLFHEDVPDRYIAAVFAVMGIARHHTFQVLTKRAERMAAAVAGMSWDDCVSALCLEYPGDLSLDFAKPWWPLPNVWLGTSVEDQATADARIPHLLSTPASIRFLSCEPLLSPIDLDGKSDPSRPGVQHWDFLTGQHTTNRIAWVIGGFESGPGARPGHPDWARSLRDQCLAADVPFFWKQNGEWVADGQGMPFLIDVLGGRGSHKMMRIDRAGRDVTWDDDRHDAADAIVRRVGKQAAGRTLDGRTWDEFPAPAGGRAETR